MRHHMIRDMGLLVACVVSISPTATADVPMIRLGGTPQEIGRTWGELNKKAIAHDMDVQYLQMAAAAGISRETLIERSAAYVKIVEEIAPHWLEETRAIARAAGVPEDLFLAFYGGISRKRFLHDIHGLGRVWGGRRLCSRDDGARHRYDGDLRPSLFRAVEAFPPSGGGQRLAGSR